MLCQSHNFINNDQIPSVKKTSCLSNIMRCFPDPPVYPGLPINQYYIGFFLFKSLSWMLRDVLNRNCCCVTYSSLKCDSIFIIQGSLLAEGSAGRSCVQIWMSSSFCRKGKIPCLLIFQFVGVGRGQRFIFFSTNLLHVIGEVFLFKGYLCLARQNVGKL